MVGPVQPSAPDLWAAKGTFELTAEEKRRICVMLNRVPAAGRQRDEMLKALEARGITVLPATLGNRTPFSQAFALGLGVSEAGPRTVAATEPQALAEVMLALIAAPTPE